MRSTAAATSATARRMALRAKYGHWARTDRAGQAGTAAGKDRHQRHAKRRRNMQQARIDPDDEGSAGNETRQFVERLVACHASRRRPWRRCVRPAHAPRRCPTAEQDQARSAPAHCRARSSWSPAIPYPAARSRAAARHNARRLARAPPGRGRNPAHLAAHSPARARSISGCAQPHAARGRRCGARRKATPQPARGCCCCRSRAGGRAPCGR